MTAAAFHIGKRVDGGSLRRFATPKAKGRASVVLHPQHPAILEQRTLFPSRRRNAGDVARLLKSGVNASKIGKRITKGKWRNMPVFTLTLEERKTCPTSCAQWSNCYGNNMHLADRMQVDDAFTEKLVGELAALQDKHPRGFVVRLHILGDFPSLEYVGLWATALDRFPALRVFGYTAHLPTTEIGAALNKLSSEQWDRFALRFSGQFAAERGAVVIEDALRPQFVICPAQLDKTDCCSTCGLCWQSKRTVAFLKH